MSKTMHRRIPMLDLSRETDQLWDELSSAIQDVLRSGHFILGPNVGEFEREVADFLGVRYAIGLNSGTDALVIGLRALGIGPGDEVITTPFTFFATAEAISSVGATPVFVDIEPETFNLDVTQVEGRITPKTKAIIPVHLFGHAVEMNALMALAEHHKLRVLEDVAQAFGGGFEGRMLGSIGDVGAFSFFPTKNLGGYGDGGLLTTNDPDVADAASMLRAHGSRKKYFNEEIGYNSRLDELQAAILRVKLPVIDQYNSERQRVANRYEQVLGDCELLTLPTAHNYAKHVYHQYTVRIRDGKRDEVKDALAEAGIATMIYYPVPVHQLPVYRSLGYSLPNVEQAAAEVLSLPIWPQLTDDEIDHIGETFQTVLDAL